MKRKYQFEHYTPNNTPDNTPGVRMYNSISATSLKQAKLIAEEQWGQYGPVTYIRKYQKRHRVGGFSKLNFLLNQHL